MGQKVYDFLCCFSCGDSDLHDVAPCCVGSNVHALHDHVKQNVHGKHVIFLLVVLQREFGEPDYLGSLAFGCGVQ